MQKYKGNIVKVIVYGVVLWALLTCIMYVITGSLRSAIPFGIIFIIAIARFVIPNLFKLLRR